MPFVIKLAVDLACAGLKNIGELFWHDAQRYILPIIYSLAVSVQSHCLWLGLTTLPMILPIDMGYKVYGSSDGFDRGMWLFMACVAAGLGPSLTGHLSWFAYVSICIFSGVWGATTRRFWNVLISPISGWIIGSFIWFIH